MAKWQSKNDETLLAYNAIDTCVTARVFEECLRDPDWLTPRVQGIHEVKVRLAKIASRMNRRGFMVDKSRRRKLARELKFLHLENKSKLLALVGDAKFTGKPDDMRALLFKRHARPNQKCFELDDPRTDEGWTDASWTKCAVDKPALLNLFVHPRTPDELKGIIEAYWHTHAPRKARSTYLTSKKVMQATGQDGRLRAEWNSNGTETFRWSCSAPNLMNLSEKQKEDSLTGEMPNVRGAYRAAPGYKLVHADWSQQELRMMEAVAGDPALKQNLDTGDVYSANLKAWFPQLASLSVEEIKEKHKGHRKGAKIIHLGSQYAAGVNAIHVQALKQDRNFRYSQTAQLHKLWLDTYRRTTEWWQEELERVNACGYSEGRLLGNRRYYPRPPPITETANFPIQDSAGEMTALAMLKIEDALRRYKIDGYFVTILHDAFDIECRTRHVPDVRRIMEDVMTGPWKVGDVTRDFPVEMKVGTHWDEV